MADRDLEHFTLRFYEDPRASRAVAALRALAGDARQLRSLRDPDGLVYLFGRAARRDPEAHAGYRALLPHTHGVGEQFVAFVLRGLDTPGAFSDPLAGPAASSRDLDRLWAEFVLTGAAEPVLAVARVLAWPDELRAALERWLAAPETSDEAVREAAEALARDAGVELRERPRAVRTEGDLDLAVLLEGLQFRAPEALRAALAALPFALAPEALERAATKASALWSLGEHAARHPAARRACERAFADAGPGAARELLGAVLAATAPSQ